MGRLVARCRPNLESVNEPHPREQVERPVDARDANQPPLRAQAVEDLLRRQTAVLVREQLKHSRAGAACPVPSQLELVERVLGPAGAI